MKTKTKMIVALVFLLAGASSAKAGILDLRVGAGLSAANPKGFENRVNNLSGADLSAGNFDTYNADAVLHLPVLPITVGVRYEQASQKKSGSANGNNADWKLNVNNLALLVDWRIINTIVYAGPIVSVGYPWANLKFHGGAAGVDHQLDRQQLSYSGGLEAGVYLGPVLVGAEAGYKSIRLKSSGSSAVNTNVNLEGFYGKALVGVTFL